MDLFSYMLWMLLLCATIIMFFLISLTKPKSYAKNLPPGPSPLPIFGNLLDLLPYTTKPHKYFAELAKTHGPIMSLQLGSITAIIVSNSVLAKQILLKNHKISSTLYDLDAVQAHDHEKFSIGPLSASSPMWKILRKIYNTRLLSDKMMEAMQTHRYRKLEDLLCYMKISSEANICVDVGQVVYDASFNMICSTIFSMDLSSDIRIIEIKNLMDCIIQEIGRPNIVDCYPFLKMIDPQRIKHRLTIYCVKLFKLFDEIVGLRLKSKEGEANYSGLYNDLLDVILDVMEEQKDEINGDHLHHLLLDLLGAGMDTTSKTIEWAMAELLRNPSVLLKLQEELEGVMGKGKNTVVQESNISQLPYLQAVVKETLRLHPAAPLLLPRKVEQDIDIDGFLLPKDAMLIINAWAIGRDPNTWTSPDLFSPERFLGSELEVKTQFSQLFTFGAGKKICPGMPLAMCMISLVLGNLIHKFDWKLEDCGELQQVLDMDDHYGITIKKAKSLRAFPIQRFV
ncbi:geraniol 8-hydroxylase-like [Beta vulgaris subsp. vulgaris]|uniref:geraniol 8-hydroxylase-like n=1 Tax=Beta vulgaris subsp. vulgaris TaxID=3555 RepID=UPI0020368AC1|nr:geraniol 8-hydroxylase-like [Beta vulgaris subsp. vulgaris]